jgi:hypothetical protein
MPTHTTSRYDPNPFDCVAYAFTQRNRSIVVERFV